MAASNHGKKSADVTLIATHTTTKRSRKGRSGTLKRRFGDQEIGGGGGGAKDSKPAKIFSVGKCFPPECTWFKVISVLWVVF